MKFNHLQAFTRHLETADPAHLSSVYLIVDPESYSQRKYAQGVCQKDEEWQCYDADALSLAQLDELLNTSSMFSQKECVCLMKVEKLNKKGLQLLVDYSKKPHKAKRLVLTASSMTKDLAPFAKNGVALDLTMEKPWDKEKRLSASVMQGFKKYSLRASSSVCDQFVKLCGSQASVIDKELEKISLFLYGQQEVSLQDLEFVLASPQLSIFKVTQSIFDQHYTEALSIISKQKFPLVLLILSLRSAVQRSYRLKSISKTEYASKMPQIKGYLLEKSLKLADQYTKAQFKKMLQILFQVELLMKSQPVSEESLMSLLIFQMRGLVNESH